MLTDKYIYFPMMSNSIQISNVLLAVDMYQVHKLMVRKLIFGHYASTMILCFKMLKHETATSSRPASSKERMTRHHKYS